MPNRFLSLPLALLCASLGANALAAPPPAAPPARLLTLDEALRLAERNNYDLKAAQAHFDQAATGVEQAWAALLPQVSAQGRYTHNYKQVALDFTSQAELQALQGQLQSDTIQDLYTQIGKAPSQKVLDETKTLQDYVAQHPEAASSFGTGPMVIQRREQLDGSLQATVPLVVPWAYPAISAARKNRDAARAGFETTRTQVLFGVAQAFYAAAGTDELLGAQEHGVEVARKTLDDAQARVDAGMANRVEVTRAQVAYERAEQAVAEAHDTRAKAYRGLATLIGLQGAFQVVPNETAPIVAEPIDALMRQALKLRPEFAQLDRSVAAAQSQSESNAWRWAPTLSAFGRAQVFNYSGFAGDNYSWAVGAQLDWLIYDGGLRDAQRHLANAQQREAEARLAGLQLSVRDDIANAEQAVGTKRQALATAQHTVELSKEALELVRLQHEAGTATQLDLLQAQDSLMLSEVALAQARFDLALADLALRRDVGSFDGAAGGDK